MAIESLLLKLAFKKKFQGSLTAFLRRKVLLETSSWPRTFLWKSEVEKHETQGKCNDKRIAFSNSAGQATPMAESPGKPG